MYQDFEEAVSLTVRDKRSHEPEEADRAVYERSYRSYLALYDSLISRKLMPQYNWVKVRSIVQYPRHVRPTDPRSLHFNLYHTGAYT